MGSRDESQRVNLAGTRTVFQAGASGAYRGRPRRLVYTSSVAAYGYYSDNPVPLTEDVSTRGSPELYYSEQKAALEAALARITQGSPLEVFVLRPCIVAGPNARLLAEAMPWNWVPLVRSATRAIPLSKHWFPIQAFPFSSCTMTTLPLRSRSRPPHLLRPDAYNIAGDGVVSMSDVVAALGARPVRVPAVAATVVLGALARLPFVPSAAQWLHVARTSVVMDTSKAKTQLGWTPRYTSAQSLEALAASL